MSQSREMLGSRLGFLLLSAGCAIGLGNVWRFPYITGAYGGAVFVGVYLLCLLAVLPVMIMEFAVGRASRSNMGRALKVLPPEGTRWHMFSKIPLWGSYLLSMFYTTVTGWMLAYCWHSFSGNLSGLDTAGVASFFGSTLASPFEQVLGMTIVVGVGCLVCAMGVQKGVERVVKVIMVGLLAILVLLVVRSLTLPGAGAGVSFYLAPDVEKMQSVGWYAVLNAAMTQAFFTLSVGIGNMTIFGSYQSKDRSLTGEALWIMSLDTFVAIMAGLIIFPACFAFSVAPNSGPGLIFITLPNIFNAMDGGILWGTRRSPRSSPCSRTSSPTAWTSAVCRAAGPAPCISSACGWPRCPVRWASTCWPTSSPWAPAPACWTWKTSCSATTCCPSAACSSCCSAAGGAAGAGTTSWPRSIRARGCASRAS